jgi:hypothetical protein
LDPSNLGLWIGRVQEKFTFKQSTGFKLFRWEIAIFISCGTSFLFVVIGQIYLVHALTGVNSVASDTAKQAVCGGDDIYVPFTHHAIKTL